jgi:hypothetical protein
MPACRSPLGKGNPETCFHPILDEIKSKMKTSCMYCETYHHVGISDGFHLVHIVTLDDGIEQGVQIVEEVDHLIARKTTPTKLSNLNRVTSFK